MGGRNFAFLLSSAKPTKRSVTVFVTKISVGGSSMVVGREYQILQVAYRAVLRKLPDILSVISGQFIDDRVRKLLRTGQLTSMNSYSFCSLRDSWFPSAYVVELQLVLRHGWYTLP